MLLEPHAVTSLRHNGHPLHITVAQEDNKQHTIHVQGRGSYWVNTLEFHEDVIALLHTAFSHYPSPVTINSKDVERTPFPDLSTVHLVHAPSMERTWTKLDPHPLSHHQAGHPHLNTYTGGILTDLYSGSVKPHRYFTALHGTMPHWRPCAMVIVSPVYVVTDDELDSITASQKKLLCSTNIPPNDQTTIDAKAVEQMARTLVHPDIPPPINQEPIHYVTGAPLTDSQSLKLGSPIVPISAPVVFRDSYISGPTLVSATQALYRTDAAVVPAITMNHHDAPTSPQFRVLETIEFNITPAKYRHAERESIRPVEDIRLWFRLDGDDEYSSVPAPFAFHGNDIEDMEVDFVPHRTSPEDLVTHMVRAYQEYLGHNEFQREETDRVTKAINNLVAHISNTEWQTARREPATAKP